jgi:kinesin family protein 5
VVGQRYVLDGRAQESVSSVREVMELLRRGTAKVVCMLIAHGPTEPSTGDLEKRRAATAMNERSSRAHTVFVVTLKQTHPETEVTVTSSLMVADLGGISKPIRV